MRNYVIINGVNSLTIPGLAIKDLPPISKPLMRNQKETVDGRNGDLITKLGYSAYDKTMTIGLYGNYDINQIIAFFNQEGTIVFSDEDDKYYNFKILEQIDFAKLVKFRTANVRIHCQPFKYPIVEEPIVIELEAVEDEGTSVTLNNTAEGSLKIDLEGNTYQETTLGTNYFNANNITSSSMTVAEEGKTITINAVTSGNGARDTGKKLSQLCPNLQVDDVVYLYFTRSLGTSYNNFIYLVGASVQWTNGTSKTITQAMLDSNVYLYANRFQDGETGNCILTDFRIVENTTDTWEKFTNNQPSPNPQYSQDVDVVTGDNTIKVENKNLMPYETYDADTQRNMQMPNLKLKAGTYTISFDLDSFNRGTNTNFDINMNMAYAGGGSLDTRIIRVDSATTTGRKNATFTLTSDTTGTISNNIRISTTQYNNGARAVLNNIQIESGSTATDYMAHQEQVKEIDLGNIELCKIGTYKDYLYKSGDKWYKHTEIGKVVLDETDSWSLFFNTNGVFVNTSLINAVSDNASINCISDNFTGQTRSNIRYNLGTTDGEVSTSGTELVLSNKNVSTTTDFQTWLSTHNTSVYYILATATEEEITNSELISQLNSLLGATSYLNQTNVNQENSNLAFNMKVSAIKKGSNEATINNTGNIYAKPILEIEGSGMSGIYIGNTQLLSIDMISDITINTELMEAYDPDTLQLRNRQITGSYENIKLEPGNTTMKVSGGITKVTIKNWKRWL